MIDSENIPTEDKSIDCPYLDTINRGSLDFDFEKCCSVSLSPVNVYACLVCGRYFQGRGKNTYAHTHCLEATHHIFMRLCDGSLWCLPEGYRIEDRSLEDIPAFLNPTFSKKDIESLDVTIRWSRAINGTEYMPGLVGLNNMRANDYVNVVVQILARVQPLRDFFLDSETYCDNSSLLVQKTGELLKKIWYPKQFKGQVSPYEFMQAVMVESEKQFVIDKKKEPLTFLVWLLNALHRALTRCKLASDSIISKTFRGEMDLIVENSEISKHKIYELGIPTYLVKKIPFLLLGLDLPAIPMFKDAFDRMQIPQVPLSQLLKKYDSKNIFDDIKEGRKRFRLTRLPRFLIISIRRFYKNKFFWEKNPSIVNFPIKNLDLKEIYSLSNNQSIISYDLIITISHEGNFTEGTYKAFVHRKIEDLWYEVQDLSVMEVLPQLVALSEAYLQVYEQSQNN
jgi:U4/U6.U5 tri-snRNP-associated protein 2